jgi:transposase
MPSSHTTLIVTGPVERTFAWIGRNRRMAKDYEQLVQTGEMLTYMAKSRVMLRRPAKAAT